MASFESLDNETYSAARKQDDQWVASITPADFFIVNKEGSLTTIKDMSIQQMYLQRLCCICVHIKIAGNRNKTKMITITLTKNWLKTFDLHDMIGYNKKSSKKAKKYLKRNGAPFTPESSTRLSPCLKKYLKRKGATFTPESSRRKSPRLLLSKQLSTTREARYCQ